MKRCLDVLKQSELWDLATFRSKQQQALLLNILLGIKIVTGHNSIIMASRQLWWSSNILKIITKRPVFVDHYIIYMKIWCTRRDCLRRAVLLKSINSFINVHIDLHSNPNKILKNASTNQVSANNKENSNQYILNSYSKFNAWNFKQRASYW